jgi:nucleotide-binding universal stress UspA family protein
MSKVILVLSTSGTQDEVIDYAVQRAVEESSGLVALYLLDTELAREAFDTFTDIGFIGDRPSQELSESLMREYRQRGYEELGRVQVKAMEAGVDYEPVMEEGGYVATVLDMINSTGAGLVVLVRRRERSFMKYFSKSLAEEVKDQTSCEVVIFKET